MSFNQVGEAEVATEKYGDVRNVVQEVKAEPDWMSYVDFLKSRTDVTKAFCETAKSYIQLSSAALALPILLTQAILGKDVAEKGLQRLDRIGLCSLGAAWGFFLLAILFGSAYQWLAIRGMWNDLHRSKLLDKIYRPLVHSGFRKTPGVPQFDTFNRSFLYGPMVVFFYVGAISFVVYAADSMGMARPFVTWVIERLS